MASPFRLDELGSLEFQRLCVALLDLELGGFETRAWGLSLLVDDGVAGLPRPTLVLVVWDRRGAAAPSAGRRLHNLANDALAGRRQPVGSLLLAGNVPAHDLPRIPGVDTLVLGPEQLWQRFAANPGARFRAPSALGVADLDALIPSEVAARSTADIAGAAELARVFVPTRAYTQALGVLERHHFAVLTGPPEMGKTAIARMIGLAALTNGWEMHECIRPDDLWNRFDRNRSQVFVADDAFGSTEYRPEAAERWAVDLDRVLHAMDDRHWLVWTSRPAPLKAGLRRIHREHGVERFPRPAEVEVDAAQLDSTEKALILFRHAKLAALPERPVRFVQLQGWRIVSHEHFTPERIRRFVGGRLREVAKANDANLNEAVVAEIREPTEAMASSYHALAPEQRAVLLSMLDVVPGPVTERELVAAVRRHSPGALDHPVNEIVDRLADHFVRVVHPASIAWVHPSWRDLVIDELAGDADARHAFLRACGIHGIVLALSTAGGAAGARSLPLLVHDADWDALADRVAALIPELEAPEVTMLLAALGEARRAAPNEGNALAGDVLGQLAHLWDHGATAAPVGLLAAWFELAADLEEQPHPPSAAPAWFDLVPTGAVDLEFDAVEFDDWTALVELLAERAPAALQAFGFPDKQKLVMAQFIEDAQVAIDQGVDLPHVDAVIRSLMRLAAVGPDAERAFRVAWRLRHPRVALEEDPAEPRELSPELERLLDFTMPATSDQMRVERVLRDL